MPTAPLPKSSKLLHFLPEDKLHDITEFFRKYVGCEIAEPPGRLNGHSTYRFLGLGRWLSGSPARSILSRTHRHSHGLQPSYFRQLVQRRVAIRPAHS